MFRRILIGLIGCAFFLCIPNLSTRVTKGFRLGKMAFDLYSNPAWNSKESDPEKLEVVQGILSRPLRYLGRGAQTFVFASDDGKYILKLFRYDQRNHPWREWLRVNLLRKKPRLRYDEKIHKLFMATKLAYEEASDLTGLYYIHLNQTKNLREKTRLFDVLGRPYDLDLNRYRFAIQHRGRPIREVLLEAIRQNDHARCERLLHSFADLLQMRTKRLIRNSDTKVSTNFGFLDDRAIEWDFGNYWVDPRMQDPQFRKVEREKFSLQVHKYLERVSPEFVSILDREMEAL